MTARTCPSCGATILDGTICDTCLGILTADLRALSDIINELHTQLAKQARTNSAGGPRPDPDPMPDRWHDPDTLAIAVVPLPYDQRASDMLADLRSVLVGWIRDATPDPGEQPPDDLHAMLTHLRAQDWRQHPAADEFADEIHWILGQARHCIDTPPTSRYRGPCGATLEDGRACDGDVYQVGDHLPRCWVCRATHAEDERMAWIQAIAADRLVTATTAAGALSAWGEHIKPDLVRKWAERGRLLAKGHDHRGRPLYVFAEVRALAEATRRRGSS